MTMLRCVFALYFSLFLLTGLPALAAEKSPGASSVSPDENIKWPALSGHYEVGEIKTSHLEGETVSVTLDEAVNVALERNLELKASTYDARAADAALKVTYSLYDPVLSAGLTVGNEEDLFNSFFVPVLEETRSEFRETSLSLEQKLPLGTRLTLSANLLKEDNVPTPSVNPAYDSQARLSLLQPLLKGFGRTVTEQRIILAAKDRQIALQDLRAEAFSIVSAVRDAYLEVLRNRYELSYRETSVELARRIVRENTARVKAGILAPVEKLEAEVGLQTRERQLLDARRAFDDALDAFNLLLDSDDKVYIPRMDKISMNFEPSIDKGVAAGLLKRPDIIRRHKEIEKTRTERSVARNSLLPELDLFASYGFNGLSDSAGNSFEDIGDGDNESWQVGIAFSYPLGSIASRNEVKLTEMKLRSQNSLLQQLRNEVRNEVRSAIRSIDVSRKKTEVSSQGHELAQEKLRILLRSREAGLATTRDVLDGEEDLARARTEQIASVADYYKAVTDYLEATGTLLEAEKIVFGGETGSDGAAQLFYPAH